MAEFVDGACRGPAPSSHGPQLRGTPGADRCPRPHPRRRFARPERGLLSGLGFLVVESAADLALFWENADEEPPDADDPWAAGLLTAPLVVIPFAHKQTYLDRYQEADKVQHGLVEERWPVPYWFLDTGMAALLMLLAAVDEGFGACFFGLFPDDSRVRLAFGVPEGYQAVGAMTFGYPAPDVPSPSLAHGHRPLDEVLHFGRWATSTV